MLKPWKEVAIPHADVLEGTFQQSEFAADLTAVRRGNATTEYGEAAAFFERTFITEGMRLLLTQVAERLTGKSGEPVIQLQTAFGGGKTHTLLAVYHLATRTVPLSKLAGVSQILDTAGLVNVPQARVAVLDGNAHAPGQLWKHGTQSIRTLWGELAWQLGGEQAYALLKGADETGTSPGKEVLADVLGRHAPCVVLIDELVAYVRQFAEGEKLSGGTYDTNMSFIQALTEAAKVVPNAIVLGSLPESDIEAGSQRGVAALRALEKTFGRVQALWKPIATDEAFEIVRRRLFQPLRNVAQRDAVCRAFADSYVAEGSRFPSETQESRYYERLVQAYPIHPEVFDRLYEDWTTIEGFQRTRGVLKLMAKVIYRLWKDDNKDFVILPGSLPLHDGSTRNEFTYYLQAGWDPVVEKDIDGERAETTELESKEPRFGQVNAARRVARTLFLGSAPSSVVTKAAVRGLDRGRVLLGCLQPGQMSSTYSDALNRLADRLHYLNTSGDRTQDSARYWFDTRANLRREMEDRKRRFDDATDVRMKLAKVLERVVAGATLFDGSHVFTPHSDVRDDEALRLVVLPPDRWYVKEEQRVAFDAAIEAVRSNGAKPRYRGNRLLFLAADNGTLSRLKDSVRVALAWRSIVDDIQDARLVVDILMKQQAERETKAAEDALPRVARECYRWLLVPTQNSPTDREIRIEPFALNTSGSSLGAEIEKTCAENELVITAWSPIHLRERLRELYWKDDLKDVTAMTFWEDTLRYLYLPRLRNRAVLAAAIRTGAASRDFFGIAYGRTGERYEGFSFGTASVQVDDTLLLIDPETATAYELARATSATPPSTLPVQDGNGPGRTPVHPPTASPTMSPKLASTFHGTAELSAPAAKAKLVELADEIISVLAGDPNATVRVTVEISADFLYGAPEQIRRAVSENAKTLYLKTSEWE